MTDLEATAQTIHDLLRMAPGTSDQHRALHAKGIAASGRFVASGALAGLTTAAHLLSGSTEAIVRFSHPGGDPKVSDALPSGRGLAVKLATADGSHQLVAVSSPSFLVRDGEAFVDLILARAPDPETGAPDPAKIGAFLAAHPEALPAIEYAMTAPVPTSYAELTYNGLHTFFFVDKNAKRTPFRFSFVPTIDVDDAPDGDLAPDHLARDLSTRLAAGPVDFILQVMLGTDHDPIDDPTAIWSERPTIDAGALTLDAVIADPEPVIFDPNNVVPGVEVSNDQILAVRRAVYGLSYARRTA